MSRDDFAELVNDLRSGDTVAFASDREGTQVWDGIERWDGEVECVNGAYGATLQRYVLEPRGYGGLYDWCYDSFIEIDGVNLAPIVDELERRGMTRAWGRTK